MQEPLYILDGYSLIYRTYYAFLRKPLLNNDGNNRSVIYGFFNTLFSFFDQYKPKYFIVALDPKTKTFRHSLYPEYKANREKTPDDLHEQTSIVEEILIALNIPIARVDNYEADDVIASYSKICGIEQRECYIISGDKDLFQLVNKFTKILAPDIGSYIEYDEDKVFEKYGVKPEQILDYLSLVGDSADNIPGVAGVGKKTAQVLIEKYGTLENIFKSVEEIPEKMRDKINKGKESAFLSKDLISLVKDLELPIKIEDINLKPDSDASVKLFLRENMKTLAKKVGFKEEIKNIQNDLFQEAEQEEEISKTLKSFKENSVEIILTEAQLNRLIEKVNDKKIFSFDCETNSVDDMVAKPIGFSVATDGETGVYIPIISKDLQCLDENIVQDGLRKILENQDNFIIGQNIKYDLKVLRRWGIDFIPNFDTMIAAWLIDSNVSRYGMDFLAEKYLDYSTIKYSDITKKGKFLLNELDIKITADYAGEDAFITFALYEVFKEKLKKLNLDKIFYEIEMKLLLILADMEMEGIRADTEKLKIYSEILSKEINFLEDKIYLEGGCKFNINSPQQLQKILFEDLKLPLGKKTKTGYSTDEETLLFLKNFHPIIKFILRYRTISKLKSTYIDALPQLINNKTGKIHTSYFQVGTATGRLSSKEPNLQNIPIKEDEGRKIREAFISDTGKIFLSADYSQIELVVLAGLSNDRELCKAFYNGEDIHLKTAAFIFGKNLDEVTGDERRAAKTINFGVLYGMSSFALANELKSLDGIFVNNTIAKNFIDIYFETYKDVKKFFEEILKNARKSYEVKNIFGYTRKTVNINNSNRIVQKAEERVAINTVIQGTAAVIMKLAMIKIYYRMREKNLRSKMILQIHDELLFEVEKGELEIMKQLVKESMESAYKFDIPLRVSIEVGKNWGEFH